ncbi:MAG: TIGR03943 family putative permease subunit [Actinomycetota bacterium]
MSNSRLARAIVLTLWAGFFGYLWVSGEMVRFLGPRTYWVVPFGCATLGAAAVAHFVALRMAEGTARKMSRSDLIGIVTLLIPILAVIAVPQAELGALAASRKATGAGATSGLLAPPAPEAGRPPNFIDVHFANSSDEYAATLGIGEGTELNLTGFVSGAGAGELTLTRFYVSCCAADAIPYSVTVVGEATTGYPDNTWLRVSGVLQDDGTELKLAPDSIEEVKRPDSPYLY